MTLKPTDLAAYKQDKRNSLCINNNMPFYYNSEIPIRFRLKTLANLKMKNKFDYKNLITSDDSLFITGAIGTGKTHLAVSLAMEFYLSKIEITKNIYWQINQITVKHGTVLFMPATELFLKLKNSFGNKDISEMEIIDNLNQVDLLILDDLGTDKVSDWSRQIIYTIIDRRYRDVKQMIITSNLDLNEFANLYDDRIASRLLEMGKVISLTGNDMRKDFSNAK